MTFQHAAAPSCRSSLTASFDRYAYVEAAYVYGYTSWTRFHDAGRPLLDGGCDPLKNDGGRDSRRIARGSRIDRACRHSPLGPNGGVSSFVVDGIADVAFRHPKSNSLPASVLRALADEISRVGEPNVRAIRASRLRAFAPGRRSTSSRRSATPPPAGNSSWASPA